MTIQTDSLELNISSLKSQLDREQFLLSEYTKTRCFFRDGKEICVTIANEVDINNTRKKIESLTNQLSNAKINLDNFLNPVIIDESNIDQENTVDLIEVQEKSIDEPIMDSLSTIDSLKINYKLIIPIILIGGITAYLITKKR